MFQNELGPLRRCRAQYLYQLITALPVDVGHLQVCLLSFREVLFSFGIRLIDLLPRWRQKDESRISVKVTRIPNETRLAQTDEARSRGYLVFRGQRM